MSPLAFAYGALAIAICSEVTGSAFLQKSDGFTKLVPSLTMAAFYLVSFFFLAQALKVLPLSVAFAIWGGVGIVLTTAVSYFIFRQPIDLPAGIGIAMIVAGVVVMNLFSKTMTH